MLISRGESNYACDVIFNAQSNKGNLDIDAISACVCGFRVICCVPTALCSERIQNVLFDCVCLNPSIISVFIAKEP